jgi:hypothetical protein
VAFTDNYEVSLPRKEVQLPNHTRGTSCHITPFLLSEDMYHPTNRSRPRADPHTTRIKRQACCPHELIATKLQSVISVPSKPNVSQLKRLLGLDLRLASGLPILHQWLAALTRCMHEIAIMSYYIILCYMTCVIVT